MSPHECSIALTPASFARCHNRAWRGLKNSRYIRGEIMWARLHAEVVTEVDDVDVLSDQPEELLETLHVELRQTLEYVVGTVRFCGEQCQEVVIPVQILAPLHQSCSCTSPLSPGQCFRADVARPRPAGGHRPVLRPTVPGGEGMFHMHVGHGLLQDAS